MGCRSLLGKERRNIIEPPSFISKHMKLWWASKPDPLIKKQAIMENSNCLNLSVSIMLTLEYANERPSSNGSLQLWDGRYLPMQGWYFKLKVIPFNEYSGSADFVFVFARTFILLFYLNWMWWSCLGGLC